MALWVAAVLSFFVPGAADASVVELGDIRFNVSQVITLLAVGFAWGDLRQWRSASEKRLEKIEKKLEEL
jgi:hypothetical protein